MSKQLQRIMSLALILALLTSILAPAALAAPELEDHWKFAELRLESGQNVISDTFYSAGTTTVYYVLNPLSVDTELRFTLQFGQPMMVSVYHITGSHFLTAIVVFPYFTSF